MKESVYKSYDELPLFLSSPQAPYRVPRRKRQGLLTPLRLLSPQSQRTALRGPLLTSPVLKVGSRMVVPKEKFIEWVEQHTGGQS